jgi:AcrR family transcriptional regulator
MPDDERPVPPRLQGRSRAGRSSRRTLSAELIAEAALALIDEDGVEALSMRRVAERLGTGAASLYAHVASKEELLDLVVDRVMAEVQVPAPDAADWGETVKQLMRNHRAVLRAHRDIARIALARIPTGPNALPVLEQTLALLRASGLSDRVVGLAPDLMALYVDAVTFEETLFEGSQHPGPEATLEDVQAFARELRDFFAALPEDRYPNLRAMAAPLTSDGNVDPDERFEFALDVIVRGLQAIAADERA